MSQYKEIIFTTHGNSLVHVIKLQATTNSKLGMGRRVITTYHYSIDQVLSNNIKLDRKTCGDCSFSYNMNDGSSGKCYTHKGFQLMGLRSMLGRLHRNMNTLLQSYDKVKLSKFITEAKDYNVELLRLGAYGEPINMPISAVQALTETFPKFTGYTHAWHKKSSQRYSKYLMASTASAMESNLANDMGWRSFNIGTLDGGVNCPASKESKKKTTCASCVLCGGTKSNSKKNIWIAQH